MEYMPLNYAILSACTGLQDAPRHAWLPTYLGTDAMRCSASERLGLPTGNLLDLFNRVLTYDNIRLDTVLEYVLGHCVCLTAPWARSFDRLPIGNA